jgi:hypothetical protein
LVRLTQHTHREPSHSPEGSQQLTGNIAFDETNLILYATIFQIFRIWFIPFYYAPARLTCVLHLRKSPSTSSPSSDSSSKTKYYIAKQEDLYQVDQWIRFIAPGGWMLIWLWQAWATVFCVAGTVLLWPITWMEENWGWGEGAGMQSGTGLVKGFRLVGKNGKDGEVRVDGLKEEDVLAKTELRGRIVG